VSGEPASQRRSPDPQQQGGKSNELRGNVRKRRWGHSGVWRQKGPKAIGVNQGELLDKEPVFMQESTAKELDRAAVRASVVAKKRRNGCGAKGRRKVEA
jgi:hypothetical protein